MMRLSLISSKNGMLKPIIIELEQRKNLTKRGLNMSLERDFTQGVHSIIFSRMTGQVTN